MTVSPQPHLVESHLPAAVSTPALQSLKSDMQGLLRLHMSLTDESSDEAVLAVYPTTIRRKILRSLYMAPLGACYLFQDCGVKFLDALMMGARVELFMPKVMGSVLLLALVDITTFVLCASLVGFVQQPALPCIAPGQVQNVAGMDYADQQQICFVVGQREGF